MKKLLLTAWCIAPIGAAAFHYGPGQELMQLDEAAELIARAQKHAQAAAEMARSEGDLAAASEWADAEALFEEALGTLPPDRIAERRAVQLERAKCQMMISELPEANATLAGLVDELEADPEADPQVLRDARRTFANSEYYMTWLMRLEGAGRDEWEPRIEAARQSYKLLVQDAVKRSDSEATKELGEDLEAAIRLERMDLGELQGLPLPSQ